MSRAFMQIATHFPSPPTPLPEGAGSVEALARRLQQEARP
jgi:hypothetical protein